MADRETDFSSRTGPFHSNLPRHNRSEDSTMHHNPHHVHGGNSYHLGPDVPSDTALEQTKTAGSISITPELFEKIYLSPANAVKGDLRKTFANPTPIGLLGFILALSPLSCAYMGWRGAAGDGIAGTGTYFFIGGLLMFSGGILEFFLGNTFSFVVFCSFGGYWFSAGSTLLPSFNAYAAYSPDPTKPAQGLVAPGFDSSYAFFELFMGVLCFIYLICALRTNIVFVIIFITLCLGFLLNAGYYWQMALGHIALASRLQIAAGAIFFTSCIAGWWIFFAQLLLAVDFPLQIPVGDISHLIPGATPKGAEYTV